MPVRVLVVDDSGFFRRRITEILNSDPQLEVIGSAVDGAEAVEKAAALRPDVITMDIEMPVMDGITAVRKIMAARPIPILMFSSLTTDGAKATLDALDAGAVDFLPKRFEDLSKDHDEAKRLLCMRVRTVGLSRRAKPLLAPARPAAEPAPAPRPRPTPGVAAPRPSTGHIKLVAIGTSTGGPVALQVVLSQLPANFPIPIVLIQHMPASFTPAFAQRLNQTCALQIKEASDGDVLAPGHAYLAPGGMQMLVQRRGADAMLRVVESEPGQTYKPCVDITFSSIAEVYPGNTLAVVLTGMGADGREGARRLKQGGSAIWAQDEASCVVYGMPGAVAEAGLAEKILPLLDIGAQLKQRV